jgi:glucose/arabinose dehydrogenase
MRQHRLAWLAMSLATLGACSASAEVGSATTAVVAATTSTAAPAAPTTTPPTSTTASPGTTSAPTTTSTTPPPPSPGDLVLVPVADGLEQPVLALAPPGSRRLYVVDQVGRIVTAGGEVVLDISERVLFQGEQGLLGLAFPDDFATTGRLIVNYIDESGDTRVSEFTAGDPDSERLIIGIDQPAANHNGGMIAFGPDGNLWIGMGDGGGAGDDFGNGQNAAALLGGMLRIDLDGDPYAIPDDNPGLDGWAEEKWAIGLRNPWRWAFDGDDLWIADVGQGGWEEVNVVDVGEGGGLNFGWPVLEGTHCFANIPCEDEGMVVPVAEYSHGDGCSVTGGFVYRGDAIPGLDGHYFYGDYCGGWIRSLVRRGGGFEETQWLPPGTVTGLTGFGVDGDGELYVTSVDGSVYRIELG